VITIGGVYNKGMNSTGKREMTVQFTVVLDCFRLNLKAACSVSVVWKKSERSVETRSRKEFANGIAKFEEELQL
jgi:hypothetical protein